MSLTPKLVNIKLIKSDRKFNIHLAKENNYFIDLIKEYNKETEENLREKEEWIKLEKENPKLFKKNR